MINIIDILAYMVSASLVYLVLLYTHKVIKISQKPDIMTLMLIFLPIINTLALITIVFYLSTTFVISLLEQWEFGKFLNRIACKILFYND